MKRLHIALEVEDIAQSVADYSQRLGCAPAVVAGDEYALWRTNTLNVSIRKGTSKGRLRHLGWEDPSAPAFTASTDCNGLEWEHFTQQQQQDEIRRYWPDAVTG